MSRQLDFIIRDLFCVYARAASYSGMATIARLTVVLIILPITVFIVHLGLIVFMTIDALKELVIGRVHMAGRAALPFFAMFAGVNSEILAVMIERRRQPGVQGMAGGAIVREIQRHMVGIRRPLEIRLMASKTIRGCTGIPVVHVALGARRGHMRAQQRETRATVIKRRRLPRRSRVA